MALGLLQIKTAKTDIEELGARISKADSKAEVPWQSPPGQHLFIETFFGHNGKCVWGWEREMMFIQVCASLRQLIDVDWQYSCKEEQSLFVVAKMYCTWVKSAYLGFSVCYILYTQFLPCNLSRWLLLRRQQPPAFRRPSRASQQMKLTSRHTAKRLAKGREMTVLVPDCSSTVAACDITCHDSTWGCGWGAWKGKRCLETQITPDLKWMDVDKSYRSFWWSFSCLSMGWQIIELVCVCVCVGGRVCALDASSIMS